jgi:hypothetical protein
MQNTQAIWDVARVKLNTALAQYKGSPTALAKASGVDFYAARRFLKYGAKSRGTNAYQLCAYFGIDGEQNAHFGTTEITALHRLIAEVWDGTRPHAELLAKLIESTRAYAVNDRLNSDVTKSPS